MLPLELLKVICGSLSRDDLDALMLANVLFRDVVLRDFAEEPFRYFPALYIHEHRSYAYFLDGYRCVENDDFAGRMRLARVGKLEFSTRLVFDESIFKVLLLLKDAWRDGLINTPRNFASQFLFERAFGELFFCKSMHYNTILDGPLNQPFLILLTVRDCTSLCIFHAPSPLNALEVIEWLNVDALSKEPKQLEMGDDGLASSVENLVHHLKTDFLESTSPRRYVIAIGVEEAYDHQLGRFVNKTTSEELIIGLGDSAHDIRIERKPTDEK